MLKDYLGQFEVVGGIKLYPVKVLDWDEFQPLSSKFLLYGYDFLDFRLGADENTLLFDLMVSIITNDIINGSKQECRLLKDFERMFSIVLRKECHVMVDNKSGKWWVSFDDGNGVIDRDNYDEIRDVILRQNLIHEPLIVPDEYSQKIIDDGIRALSSGGRKSDLESMVAYVCNLKGIDANEMADYSYYRLRCDVEMWQRIEMNRAIHIYKSQGAKCQTINEFKEFECHKNPYSWDALFEKDKGDGEMAKMMAG